MAVDAKFTLVPFLLIFLEIQGLFTSPGGPARMTDSSNFMENILDTIKLRLYGRYLNEHEDFVLNTEADKLTRSTLFSVARPTVVYIHGYTETLDSESVKTVISALMGLSKYNLIVVDWSVIASKFYLVPALLSVDVGRLVANRLDQWHREGVVPISNVYVVGHSLGGQVAGFIGKNVKEGKIPRITGLDPAYPGFSVRRFTVGHLTDTDAHFVDVIHTDAGSYGEPYPTGHADFFPNGGRRLQPGCPAGARHLSDEEFCSHWRSWRFFAESMNRALPPFEAVACPSQEDFEAGKCDGHEKTVMGYYTPNTTRGLFFLETTSEEPFSKGSRGIVSSRRVARRRSKAINPLYAQFRALWSGR